MITEIEATSARKDTRDHPHRDMYFHSSIQQIFIEPVSSHMNKTVMKNEEMTNAKFRV